MNFFHCLIIVAFFSMQSAEGARHCKSSKALSAAEQLATLDPRFDLNLVDLDLFSGGSIITGYDYEVEPAYTNGLYSRTDSWQFGLDALPSRTLSERIRSVFNFGVKAKTEATFIRFFKDPCEAMLSNPYSPKRIPLTASKALSPKFRTGDYFLFRGSLGVIAGLDVFSMLGSTFWATSLSSSYLMEGSYQVHIVRIDDKRIRLKVIALRGQGVYTRLGLGYENEFHIFGVDRLDSKLERFVNTKPVKLTASANHSKVFMIDYVLDLSDPEIVEAYESLFPKFKNFKNINLIEEFKKGVDSDLLLDLSRLEEIYRQDFENGRDDRLKRNLRTHSDQYAKAFGLEVGNRIVGFKLNRGSSSANMSIPRPNDFLDRYLLKSWEKKSESRFFYSWIRNKKNEGIRALFRADEEFINFTPLNFITYIHQKKNRFSFNDLKKLKLRMKKALPTEIYGQIPWEEWNQRKGKTFLNFGLRYEFSLAPEVILNAPELSVNDIKVLFRDHIKSKGLKPSDYFIATNSGHSGQKKTPEERFEQSLRSLAKKLSQALNRKLTSKHRIELISSLRKNTLFSSSGISFLMSLFPDRTQEYCSLDLNISSNEAIIDFSYGQSDLSSLYKKILTIKAALDDEGLDLIREAESLSSILESNPNRI